MPVNQISEAISRGTIDGAAVPPAMLSEFGVGRLAGYHYMIHADAPSLALVMSRKTFASLPSRAQDIIRKYSGEWSVARSNEFFEDINAKSMEQLKAIRTGRSSFLPKLNFLAFRLPSRRSSTIGMRKALAIMNCLKLLKLKLRNCGANLLLTGVLGKVSVKILIYRIYVQQGTRGRCRLLAQSVPAHFFRFWGIATVVDWMCWRGETLL